MAPNHALRSSDAVMPSDATATRKDALAMSEELAELAREELGETEETRSAGLAHLRAYLSARSHLSRVRTDDVFLLRFLRAQKFNADKAAK